MRTRSKAPAGNLFPILLGVVVILLYFSRLFPAFSSAISSSFPDAYHFLWNIWYLGTGASELYHTDLLFTPFGANLDLHSLTEGLLLPLDWLSFGAGIIFTFNLAALLCFLFNFLSGFVLFKLLSGKAFIALPLALLLTFHPYFLAHLDAGHLNFLPAFLPIAVVTCLITIASEKSSALYRIFGMGSFAALPFINLYYFYYLLLLVPPFAIYLLLAGKRRGALEVCGITVLACVLSGLKLYAVAKLALSGTYTADHNPIKHSLDVLHTLLPSKYQLISDLMPASQSYLFPQVNSGESGGYVGFLALLLLFVLLMITRSRVVGGFLALGGLFLMLSFGPEIFIKGEAICVNPLYSLFSKLPLFPSVPARFSVISELFLLMAIASAYSRSKGISGVGVSLLFLLLIEFIPSGFTLNTLPQYQFLESEAFAGIHALHDTGLPIEERMYRQTKHKKIITEAFLARRPRAAEKLYRENKFLRYLKGKQEAAAEDLKADFCKLKIDAVLLQDTQADIIERVGGIKWIRPGGAGDGFNLYTCDRTKVCAE